MERLALLFVIIGALNWGLIGLFQFDLVASLFGGAESIVSRIVYTLIGLFGVYAIKFLFTDREETPTS
ncbi:MULTISPECIES: DUF378 domain-containing protein [Brevibacillus]|uniref:DUF378 domain-containing protein n=1 Tax=Brevibacillus TaxID=55080 RepID=UPI000D0FF92B|nr:MULTISPECIES: DUF378 domain-containing protein [Brevibacillus]MED1948441.1 DUF378 domain-containing protein [Brevibacillus formosus]MED1997682.1 DUF378 domain-containing protein [Brevibacillus formosus]MED2083748.1 DUF378 domain-containing protein [Brevibacillus formosus]PSK15987.1 DUF378 domain-containing protein [Brevibacillus sp. NRRL NRS-603]